jgi:hypothetical protein
MLDYSNLELLGRVLYKKLMVVSELYQQQRLMYQQKIHKVEDRIVSIHQQHICPIVRGNDPVGIENFRKRFPDTSSEQKGKYGNRSICYVGRAEDTVDGANLCFVFRNGEKLKQ